MPRKATGTKEVHTAAKRSYTVFFAVVGVLGIGLTAGAIFWGRSDAGQIDVSATIVNSNLRGENAHDGSTPTPNISNELSNMPNGGLVPQGENTVPAPVPESAPEPEATSTDPETTEGEEILTDESGADGASSEGTEETPQNETQ